MNPQSDIKVFISHRESTCGECGEDLGHKAWITLERDRGALCLSCADLDHLVFLPSGDAALTRRSKKHSTLSAVVLKWSRARKSYDEAAIRLAVIAHLRHRETEYDTLLSKGYDRSSARALVEETIYTILDQWEAT